MLSTKKYSRLIILLGIRLSVAVMLSLIVFSCGTSKKNVTKGSEIKDSSYNQLPAIEDKGGIEDEKELSEVARLLIEEARTWIGTPYRYGGKDKNGADCSGFIMEVYKKVTGLLLPRNSGKQCEYCQRIAREDIVEGDLLFFSSPSSGKNVAHVGMYIGNGNMIHASSSRGVIETSINSAYYIRHYLCSGRVEGVQSKMPIMSSEQKQPKITDSAQNLQQPVESPDAENINSPKNDLSPTTIVKNAFGSK